MKVVGGDHTAFKDAFCMDFQFPYIMYNYKAKNCKVVTIDFFIVGMNKHLVRPKVNDDGSELHVAFVVPSFFTHDRRFELADAAIQHNTHKLTAFRDIHENIIEKHGDGSEEEPILGDPQKVRLPFVVKRKIRKWEIQTFENDDKDFFQYMQEIQQHYFVLSVTLLSVEKRYKKKEGISNFLDHPVLTRWMKIGGILYLVFTVVVNFKTKKILVFYIHNVNFMVFHSAGQGHSWGKSCIISTNVCAGLRSGTHPLH